MLFAGLQGHSQGAVSLGVNTHANDPSGYGPLEIVPGSKKCGMRTAKTYWNTKTLRRTNSYVGTQLTGRSQQGQCQQIRRHGYKTTGSLNASDKVSVIRNISV